MRLRKFWALPAAGVLSTVLLTSGCGGGAAVGFGDSVAILGSASGPVFDALGKRFSVRSYDGPGSLDNVKMLIVDGDTNSPDLIASTPAIQHALDKGVMVALIDVEESHKQNLADRMGAFGHPGGKSHIFALRKVQGGNHARYESFEVPRKMRRSRKNNIRFVDGNRIEGQHVSRDYEPSFSRDAVQSFVDRSTHPAARGRDPLDNVPAQVKFIDQTTYVFDTELAADLDQQSVTTEVVYEFTAFLSNYGGGNYSQFLCMQGRGQLDTGALTNQGLANQVANNGWLQVWSKMTLGVNETTSLHENVSAIPLMNFLGGNDSYNSSGSVPISYVDGSGNLQSWTFMTWGGPQPIPGWTATVAPDASVPGVNGVECQLYQYTPFDALQGDYADGIDSQGFKGVPAITTGAIPYGFGPAFAITTPVRGRVSVTYTTERQFVSLGIYIGVMPPMLYSCSQTKLSDGDAAPYILNFASVYP